jgi:K+-sensing histidine kinase KdpD
MLAESATLAQLDAVRITCREVRGRTYASALSEIAIALQRIFSTRWVVIRGADPDPPTGLAPAGCDPTEWLDAIVDKSAQDEGLPKTFSVSSEDAQSHLSGVDRIVVVPMDQPGGFGSVNFGLTGHTPTSGDELTCFSLVGEMVGSALWRISQESSPAAFDSAALAAVDLTTAEIISIAAHELRTPLTPITMLLQSVERKARTDGFVVDTVVRTRRQVNRLAQMISDLLDLTRLRDGRLVLTRTLLELAPNMTQTVAWFREGNPKRQVELVTTREPLVILFDEDRFAPTLSSLLDHVGHITPVESVIRVELERRADRAAIRISAARAAPFDPAPSPLPSATKAATSTLAVLLAQAVSMRFGATISMTDTHDGRSVVELTFPLSASDKG